MEHTAPAWLVWLLGGAATVGGGIALAVIAREARIMRAADLNDDVSTVVVGDYRKDVA